MKNLVLASLLAGLVSCADTQESETSAALPLHSIGPGLSFSQDLRPVDGNLTELSIYRIRSGYMAKLRVLTSGFGSPVTDTVTELGTDLACFATKNRQTITSVVCSKDDRPVDGTKIALTLRADAEGSFSAELQTEYYDRFTGQPVFKREELASGLALVQ